MAISIPSTVTLGQGIRIEFDYAYTATMQIIVGGTVRDTVAVTGLYVNYTMPNILANYFGGNVSGTVTVRRINTLTQEVYDSAVTTAFIPVTPISTVTSPVTFGQSESVTFTPSATSLKYGVLYQYGPYSVWSQGGSYIEPHSTSPYTDTGTMPLTWAKYCWDAESAEIKVWLVTYTSGNREVGRVSRTVKAVVPSYTIGFTPTITEGTASGFSEYVQSLSTVRATVTGFSMGYNGDGTGYITSVSMTVDGTTYTKTGQYDAGDTVTLTSNKLRTYGSLPVVITVTDTRGRTSTQTQTLTVYQYFSPTVSGIDISVSGTTVTVDITGLIASVNNLNIKQIQVDRIRTSDNTVVHVIDSSGNFVTLSDYTFTYSFTETVADVETYSWEYVIKLKDSKTTTTFSKSTGVICISRFAGGQGVTLFKAASEQGFWVRDIDYTISDAEFTTLATALADLYNANVSYSVGDYCLHSSTLYRCKTATTGTWTAANWEAM